MIEYRETKKTKLNYIKKFTLFYCGPFFILGVAILLASVFCNLIPGISGDKTELIYAILFISLDILIFTVGPLLLYRRLYNILIFPIRDCSDEYYEELSIEYCEEKYIFKRKRFLPFFYDKISALKLCLYSIFFQSEKGPKNFGPFHFYSSFFRLFPRYVPNIEGFFFGSLAADVNPLRLPRLRSFPPRRSFLSLLPP